MKKYVMLWLSPKKVLAVFGILLSIAVMPLVSCSDEDGDWEEMKWTTSVKKDKGGVISVGSEGGTFEFKCKNYSPWMTSVKQKEDGQQEQTFYVEGDDGYRDQNLYIEATWLTAKFTGHTLTVTILPTTSQNQRTMTVNVTAGDIFDSFTFCQQGTN